MHPECFCHVRRELHHQNSTLLKRRADEYDEYFAEDNSKTDCANSRAAKQTVQYVYVTIANDVTLIEKNGRSISYKLLIPEDTTDLVGEVPFDGALRESDRVIELFVKHCR